MRDGGRDPSSVRADGSCAEKSACTEAESCRERDAKVKARLDTEIASRVRDTRQNPRMAGNPHRQQSGYGVIAPVRDGSGRDSPGAITRYLEVGHRIRKPKKRAQRVIDRASALLPLQGGFFINRPMRKRKVS